MITPSGRKVSLAKQRRKEEEENAIYSGNLVPLQRTQAARTKNFLREREHST
jgi:hypothetical protein